MSKVINAYSGGAPEVFKIETENVPHPGKGEIEIRQYAIGINHADVLVRKGFYPMAVFPFVDGFDASGIVMEVGTDVANIKVGDRVAYFLQRGAYREERIIAAELVVPIPDAVSFEAAATFITKGLTAKMLEQKLQPLTANDVVLIQGATGGVASLLVRLLKSLKVTVIGVVSSESKKKIALENGVDHVLLSVDNNINAKILEITNGKGVDAVVDGVGAATALLSVSALREGGKLVSYGTLSGPVTKDIIDNAANGKSVTIIDGQVGAYTEQIGGFSAASSEVFELILSGVFNDKMICTYPFEDIVKVHEMMETGRPTV